MATETAPQIQTLETRVARPITTFRVAIRETGRCLRLNDGEGRSFESRPCFGRADLFRDQLVEFSTETAAEWCIHWLQASGRFTRTVVLEALPAVHADLEPRHLSTLICRVRDTAVVMALAEWGLTDPTARGLADLAPLAQIERVAS